MKWNKIFPLLLIIIALFCACEKMPPNPNPDNIFDPDNPATGGDPFNLTAQLTAGGILLEWEPVNIVTLGGYRIYRSMDAQAIYGNLLTETDSSVTSFHDTTVANGNLYYYLVTAYSYLGESRSSGLAPVEIPSSPYIAIMGDSASTMTRFVQLDILASGADSMKVTVESDISQAVWEVYSTTRLCTLSAEPGTKVIQLQTRYPSGNQSIVVADSIQTRELTPSFVLGDGSGFTNTTAVIMSFGDAGALAGVVWEFPDSLNADTLSPLPETYNFSISSGDGEKMLYIHLWNGFADTLIASPIVLDTFVEIVSVQHDGAGRVLEYGDILYIELVTHYTDENGIATVDIMDDLGNLREGILLNDWGSGHYGVDYEIDFGNDIVEGYVVGRFTDRAGNIAVPDTAQGSVNIDFIVEGMAFVFGGEFDMGNPAPYAENDELPIHTVYISDFWISINEVTNAEFSDFLNDGNSQYFDNRMEIKYYPINGYYEAVDSLANKPARYVSWNGAEEYAQWRGMRLPTEAEWEEAARGTDGRYYPWGMGMPFSGLANFYNSYDPYDGTDYPTTPVGFYNGNKWGNFQTYSDLSPYGAHDMSGNVSEWCSDYYNDTYYSISPYMNPENNYFSSKRVVRSASWNTFWLNTYCANRFSYEPNTQSQEIGIRLACDP